MSRGKLERKRLGAKLAFVRRLVAMPKISTSSPTPIISGRSFRQWTLPSLWVHDRTKANSKWRHFEKSQRVLPELGPWFEFPAHPREFRPPKGTAEKKVFSRRLTSTFSFTFSHYVSAQSTRAGRLFLDPKKLHGIDPWLQTWGKGEKSHFLMLSLKYFYFVKDSKDSPSQTWGTSKRWPRIYPR